MVTMLPESESASLSQTVPLVSAESGSTSTVTRSIASIRAGERRSSAKPCYVFDGQRRLALVDTRTTPADGNGQLVRYELENHLGSATVEIDGNGNVVSYEEYHPYGTTAYRAATSTLEGNPKRYAFTSKERDEETGLYYYGARYYGSWLARWASPDPAGIQEGVNEYIYVLCNPIQFVDPNGGAPAHHPNHPPDVRRGSRKRPTRTSPQS